LSCRSTLSLSAAARAYAENSGPPHPLFASLAHFGPFCVPSDTLSSRDLEQKSQGKGSGSHAAAKKVVIIGSGNFASALAPIVGKNCERLDEMQTTVNMWVYEEEFEGQKLSEVINTEHENRKYLPGIKLPDNIVAVTNVTEAVKDANVLIFCVPHQVPCVMSAPKPKS